MTTSSVEREAPGLARHVSVLASVVAVWGVLLAPTLVKDVRDQTSASGLVTGGELPAEGPGSRDWRALDCVGSACAVPRTLDLHGRTFTSLRGIRGEVRRNDVTTRTLRWTVRPGQPLRVLVGAEGASSASDLVVQVGNAPAVAVPDGRLTLLDLPASDRIVAVTLVERGRFGADETLRIQEYAEVG